MKNKIAFIFILISFSLISKAWSTEVEIENNPKKNFHPPQTDVERALDGIFWITSLSYLYDQNDNAMQPEYWNLNKDNLSNKNYDKIFTEKYLNVKILEQDKCPYDRGKEHLCDYDYNVGNLSYNTKSDDGKFAVIFSCVKASFDYCNTYNLNKNANGIWQLDGFKCFKNKYCVANYSSKR